MPDNIANHGTLMLTVGLLAAGAMAWLLSLLTRVIGRRDSGSMVGIPVALVLWGAGMLWVVKDMALFTWQTRQMTTVQGVLLGFDAVKLRESRSGRPLTGHGPVVAFTLPDGREHELVGLSGSQAHLEPGDTVPVRVDPSDPARAMIDDFQHRLAALWLFGTLGLIALGLAVLVVLDTLTAQPATAAPVGCGRAARRRAGTEGRSPLKLAAPSSWQSWRDGPAGQRWRRQLQRVAWGTGAMALVAVFVLGAHGEAGPAIAVGLAGVATALTLKTAADALAPQARVPVTLLGGCIAVFGFGMFAALVWQLTAR